MKTMKLFFAFFAALAFTGTLSAQNGNGQQGNAVISEVKIYDNGNGTGTIEVRISGNQAHEVRDVAINLTSARISGTATLSTSQSRTGGGLSIEPSAGNGNTVIIQGDFHLLPSPGTTGHDAYQAEILLRDKARREFTEGLIKEIQFPH